ncbi:hypothetical protein, partial [Desulfovibrio sp. ZJ200]|uniref:hypothetical protein n=1 Tax=Desulfovibrio sp. ZJ200 TaxID=2709792 RepID=UPI0013EBC54C
MPDEKTPHLNLPLPHADNLLEEDVLRLREALALVDGSAAQTAADLAAQRETSAAQRAALAGVQARAAELETWASAQEQAQAATAAALTAHEAAENPHHIPPATTDRPGIVRVGQGIGVDENGAISINPWDIFPLRVPIAVDGVRFGGSDGR